MLVIEDSQNKYIPATIVLSKDNKSYVLIEGEFYSLQWVAPTSEKLFKNDLN